MLLYKTKDGDFMEIKRIDIETYESISAYIDVLLSIVPSLNDLCFIDYNGKRYMLSISENGVAVVENNNGELNSFFYDLTEPDKKIFATEEFSYKMTYDTDLKEVTRVNNLTKVKEYLAFMPPIENHPRALLEYRQVISEGDAGLIFRYDVTSRKDNLSSCLTFANYHSPDMLELHVLKEVLFLYLKRKYIYSLGVDDNKYYEPLITLGNISLGSKRMTYNPQDLIKEISSYGFGTFIPTELGDYLVGRNDDYKKLTLICNEYQKFIKGQ